MISCSNQYAVHNMLPKKNLFAISKVIHMKVWFNCKAEKKKIKFTSFVCFVRTLSFIFLSVDGTAWKYRNIEDKLWTDDCDREQMERGKKNPKVYVFGCKMCVQKRKITTTKYCFLWQKFCMKSTKLCCPFTFIKFGTI